MHISGTEPSSAIKENFDNLKTLEKSLVLYYFYVCPFLHVAIDKGVGEGGSRGRGTCPPPPTFKSGVGAQVGLCGPPPPLLGRANVLSSLFAHILWLKTQFFQYFLNFANLKL